jgi:hypothetical protein
MNGDRYILSMKRLAIFAVIYTATTIVALSDQITINRNSNVIATMEIIDSLYDIAPSFLTPNPITLKQAYEILQGDFFGTTSTAIVAMYRRDFISLYGYGFDIPAGVPYTDGPIEAITENMIEPRFFAHDDLKSHFSTTGRCSVLAVQSDNAPLIKFRGQQIKNLTQTDIYLVNFSFHCVATALGFRSALLIHRTNSLFGDWTVAIPVEVFAAFRPNIVPGLDFLVPGALDYDAEAFAKLSKGLNFRNPVITSAQYIIVTRDDIRADVPYFASRVTGRSPLNRGFDEIILEVARHPAAASAIGGLALNFSTLLIIVAVLNTAITYLMANRSRKFLQYDCVIAEPWLLLDTHTIFDHVVAQATRIWPLIATSISFGVIWYTGAWGVEVFGWSINFWDYIPIPHFIRFSPLEFVPEEFVSTAFLCLFLISMYYSIGYWKNSGTIISRYRR